MILSKIVLLYHLILGIVIGKQLILSQNIKRILEVLKILINPKFLIAVHQTAARIGVPKKAKNVALFDHLDVGQNHVYIGGVRYTRDGVNVEYRLNDYVDQYKELKLIYREYVGEEGLNFSMGYPFRKKNVLLNTLTLDFMSIILIL